MKNIIAVIVLMSLPLWANAAQPLSRELIKSFYAVSTKLDGLESKYPKTFKAADELGMSKKSEIIQLLKSSKAYPDIKSILSSNGFNGLTDYFAVSERFMGSMYSVQMEKMPKGMKLDAATTSFKESIRQMKKSGAPAGVIAEMEANLKQQQIYQKNMQRAAKDASKADKKFVSENFDWLMSIIPEEDG